SGQGGGEGRSLERKSPDAPGTEASSWVGSPDSSGATPGRRNAYVRIDRDLHLKPLRFDANQGTVTATILNAGESTSPDAVALLFVDENADGTGEPGEELHRMTVAPMVPGDSVGLEFPW